MTYDIAEFIPSYPSITDPKFNNSLRAKVEFRNPKIEATEDFPDTKGQLLTHQTLISRLMSSYTPYDGILLMHEMGTGKSCSAAAIIERIMEEKNGIDTFYYVAKNKLLLTKFADEFRSKCTKGDYSNKLSSYGIRFMTYDMFVKTHSRIVKGVLTPTGRLNNAVVVIDEIHNIREQAKTYDSYYKILRASQNIKIVLMSGTPITDTVNEIASVLNLILPSSSQLPTGSKFDSTFIKDGKLTNVDRLRKAFNGRVSYIKNMPAGVTKHYEGTTKLKKFTLDASEMSKEQTKTYLETLGADEGATKSKSPAYTASRGASDFVWNGISGPSIPTGKFVVKGKTNEDKIKYVKEFSSKYAASIETILKARAENKSVFVFNSQVNGGGLLMFAKILKSFGFGEVTANNVASVSEPRERFIVLTGETEKTEFSSRFNKADNVTGAYIRVILASTAISEGYSFENVQVIDIHSPWFNFARISQAIARGIRVGSHRTLREKNIDDAKDKARLDNSDVVVDIPDIVVDIHLRVSVPEGEGRSIETEMYQIAEEKDIIFKQVEHLIKEEAIDSWFTYSRNKRPDNMDGTRECDYMKCAYTPHPLDKRERIGLDFASYEKYYGNYDKYIDVVRSFFETEYTVPLAQITTETNQERPIVAVVAEMIFNEIPITSPAGEKCYLAEEGGILFLTNTLSNNPSLLDVYYVETGHIPIKVDLSLTPDVDGVFNSEATDVRGLNFELLGYTPEQVQTILEAHIDSVSSNVVIEAKFEGLYGVVDGVMYDWYLASELPGYPIRKRSVDLVWSDAPDAKPIVADYLDAIKQRVINEARVKFGDEIAYYGYYRFSDAHLPGTEPRTTSLVALKPDVEVDSRRLSRGRSCITMTGDKNKKIHDTIITTLGKLPEGKIKIKSRCDMIEQLFVSNSLWYRDVVLVE